MPDSMNREREKALYRYAAALDRGDFGTVAEVLSMAEQDGELEKMVLELNQAQQRVDARPAQRPIRQHSARRQPRSGPLIRSWVGFATVMVVAGCFVLSILTLLGPSIGNVFSNVVSDVGEYPSNPNVAALPTSPPQSTAHAAQGQSTPTPAPTPTAAPLSTSAPDVQFESELAAGQIDDNLDFVSYLEFRSRYHSNHSRLQTFFPIDITERHVIHVLGNDQLPILGADVLIYADQRLVTTLRTPSTGIVYFFPRAYGIDADQYDVVVNKGNASADLTINRQPTDQTWAVTLETEQEKANIKLDILFLLDSTGSMRPQLESLKDNVLSISGQIEALPGQPDVRYGLVAYRDRTDTYVTKVFDFTRDVREFQNNLNTIQSGGGGDIPESVNEGLYRAINDVSWRGDETISMVFLIADAPPHLDYAQDYAYTETVNQAAGMGIQIFPILADTGTPGQERYLAEYVFRQMAQFTGGRFIFITEDPQMGGGSSDEGGGDGPELDVEQSQGFTVQNLDVLVVQLIQDRIDALLGQTR